MSTLRNPTFRNMREIKGECVHLKKYVGTAVIRFHGGVYPDAF